LLEHRLVVALLLGVIRQKKQFLVIAILSRIEKLGMIEGAGIIDQLAKLSPTVLQDILDNPYSEWHQRLGTGLVEQLQRTVEPSACSLELPINNLLETVDILLTEPDVLIQTICLYLLHQFDHERSYNLSKNMAADRHPLLGEIIPLLLTAKEKSSITLKDLPILERIVYLFNSDFFQSLDSETLIELAYRAEVKSFALDERITEAGDTCRELLLLMEGNVEIQIQRADGNVFVSSLALGKMLDELEVLTHTHLMGTIVAKAPLTRVLAIPVEAFDDLLVRDRHLAMKVLELESVRLKSLLEAR
jgi:hypothetical protein